MILYHDGESAWMPRSFMLERSELVASDMCAAARRLNARAVVSKTYSTISFPQLESVGGKLRVFGPVSAPSLTTVERGLEMWGPLLADNLSVVGGVMTLNTPTVSLPSLTSVDGIYGSQGAMTTISLPALVQIPGVGSSPYAGAIEVNNSSLTSISMPLLTSIPGRFRLTRNSMLTSIHFPSMVSVGPELWIWDNSSLPSCYATDLHDRLVANGWTGTATIYGNTGTGPCPP